MPRVVLFEPEIPPNTGNVARTCAAMATELHLVEPLGFELSDRTLRRAALDYWPYVQLQRHHSWNGFCNARHGLGGRLIGLTSRGGETYHQHRFDPSDWLLFGRETTGLPKDVKAECDNLLTVPMLQPGVRCLNLASAVAIVLSEALRQLQNPLHD
jgi:tRNA (cytidine/uridine-2'-O-)-methyltransferase